MPEPDFSAPDFRQVTQAPIVVRMSEGALGARDVKYLEVPPPPDDAESQQWMDYASVASMIAAYFTRPKVRANVMGVVERYATRWRIDVDRRVTEDA